MRSARRITGGVQAIAPRTEKCIPNADRAFASKAESFANTIAGDPDRYNITACDADLLARRVREFLAALNLALGKKTRTATTIKAKDQARQEAEELMRAIRNQIRGDGSISRGHKIVLGITERPKKLSKRECPISPPVLRYLCGIDAEGSAPGVHVLDFRELHTEGTARKPVGAASLHLYFDLVPPGELIPQHPAERGWPKFLRPFTRSPIHVEFPKPMSGPMLVVYWGRWADAKGNVGPWSEPCVARIEGTMAVAALPEGAVAREQRMVFIQPPRQLIGEVATSKDVDASAEATAAIAALGQRVLEAATVRLLQAA